MAKRLTWEQREKREEIKRKKAEKKAQKKYLAKRKADDKRYKKQQAAAKKKADRTLAKNRANAAKLAVRIYNDVTSLKKIADNTKIVRDFGDVQFVAKQFLDEVKSFAVVVAGTASVDGV